jgi:hypothetical protein
MSTPYILGAVARSLPTIDPSKEGLGRATIMDRALAQQYGVPYVHLAVFAIDVDRARECLEDDDADEGLPMGWEVFLTERFLDLRHDATTEEGRALVEDVVLAIFDLPPSDEAVFGSQLPFAVWHAIGRRALPGSLESVFRTWKAKPKELGVELDRLYATKDESTRAIARRCLDAPLSPPLAPPVREVLEVLAAP